MGVDAGALGERGDLITEFRKVRQTSEEICQPLAVDDYQIQSIMETSPPKWHLAHVTWFYEAFILSHFLSEYQPYHPAFAYLFNSYYQTMGPMHQRPKRGLLSRPTVEEIFRYREYVDEQMLELLGSADETQWYELVARTTLGLNHEQQHQELLFMDIKHNFFVNPMKPAYLEQFREPSESARPMRWLECPGGTFEIGANGEKFAYDNETPRHEVLLQDHLLADRLVTNAEFFEFIQAGGYQDSSFWLSDGWAYIQQHQWRHPLYWTQQDQEWLQFTLSGLQPLNPHEPVCHLSFYEADAYARWTGKRLPTEAELEVQLQRLPLAGHFADSGHLHPRPASDDGQWYGDLWAWTASAYAPYPGFKPLSGSMGEYNGKFMCNQMSLKGGSCVTLAQHTRASYRNFFYPHDRWAFTGLRLAE